MQPPGPEIKEFVSCSTGRTSPHFGESQDVVSKIKTQLTAFLLRFLPGDLSQAQ